MLTASIIFGVRKALRYRINLISWFIADFSLYSSIIVLYELLFARFSDLGGFDKTQMGMYISTYFLVNNIFAIFFSEAVSIYGDSITNGNYVYYLLNPYGTVRSIISLNFNFAPLLSTPFLLVINIYFMSKFELRLFNVLIYYLGIISAVFIMTFFMLLLYSLLLFGIRLGTVSAGISQLFSIAEKPNTTFNVKVRRFFTYIIPAFMFSAVPSSIIIGNPDKNEIIALFVLPLAFYLLFKIVEAFGLKKYNGDGY
ncbi:ABC-2 family transporter protein [Pseudoclostridium thermosuccinogenes]|uniref:ABC-2 family transporter protein n=2 Tax=Clostridium thermosuccinogenes TaxID=84032 RepID=UPI002FDAC67F